MVTPQPTKDVEQILSGSLTWDKFLITCQFCYDDNGALL